MERKEKPGKVYRLGPGEYYIIDFAGNVWNITRDNNASVIENGRERKVNSAWQYSCNQQDILYPNWLESKKEAVQRVLKHRLFVDAPVFAG